MGKQVARQQARARARKARAQAREDQAKREQRLTGLGEQVVAAVTERDAAVVDCERRAGRALRSLVEEGLSTREALAWCGVELTAREVHRLVRDAEVGGESSPDEEGKPRPATPPCVSGAPAKGRG
ncbi:hypothetical protein [Ornithinimicrobium sediminis]|jgi:hypothetical protein|uniref:hypothetical protein n=1 Tax=Ornithinimicrobium sediminis TaxID=2904603 RepID=UPI001E3E5471|nr:hypothetical protein [Ornithinimicrobium sediminis]MCE0487292.1 hypothetical protein [Ornithinimicrobium sediminis]